MICSVEGCLRRARARTWCTTHYERWRSHGTLHTTRFGAERKTTQKGKSGVTTRELEWAAGFIEGEGSFVQSGNTTQVMVVQVNKEPVQRLLLLFGGTVKPQPPRRKEQQAAWRWQVCGSRARGVAMTLYSLLSEKRQRQIRHALR